MIRVTERRMSGRRCSVNRSMEMSISDFGDLGKRVTLAGRLDIQGGDKIDLPVATLAGSRTNIVIDLGASTSSAHLLCAISCLRRRPSPVIPGP
jgi:hypothetical protein